MNLVYVDTSVVLATVRCEQAVVDPSFWDQPLLVSSVLLEYETWTRLHALGEAAHLGATANAVLGAVNMVGLSLEIGARCRAPFPSPVRTLDALHLATADHLRMKGYNVRIASFDPRLNQSAAAMGFAVGLGS